MAKKARDEMYDHCEMQEDTKTEDDKEKSAILIYEMCFLPSAGQIEGYSVTFS